MKMEVKRARKAQAVFLIGGLLVSFGLSGLFHFVNEWLGNPALTAGLFPVSESVWEHMKLPFYSMLPVLLLPWCPFLKERPFTARLCGFALAGALSMLLLWGGFYGCRNGLRLEGLAADLILLAVSLFLSLWHAGHLLRRYRYRNERAVPAQKSGRPSVPATVISALYVLLMIVIFYVLSYYTPDLPLFMKGA